MLAANSLFSAKNETALVVSCWTSTAPSMAALSINLGIDVMCQLRKSGGARQFRPLAIVRGAYEARRMASTPARSCRTGTHSGYACRRKTACSWNRRNGTRT